MREAFSEACSLNFTVSLIKDIVCVWEDNGDRINSTHEAGRMTAETQLFLRTVLADMLVGWLVGWMVGPPEGDGLGLCNVGESKVAR